MGDQYPIKHNLVQVLTLDDLAVIGRDAWELMHETRYAIPEQHTMTRTWQPGDLYEYRWTWTTPRDLAPDVAKVDQRTTSDCLRACLATVTGRAYEVAPDVDGDWRTGSAAFLAASPKTGLVIGIGESPRGAKGGHAVVCKPNGELVHDPHASRDGIVQLWELWDEDGQVVDLSAITGER